MNIRKLFDWKTLFIYTHRWLGIVFGIVFVVWFVSGVAMMYVGMPHLSTTERLGHVPPLDLSSARVAPAEAAREYGLEPGRFRVEMYHDGRPIYRFQGSTKIYADTGEFVDGASAEQAVELIRQWVPQHQSTVRYDGYLTDSDQWTLYNAQRALMPLHRIAVGDAAGTYYYVSEATGEPTMKTDGRSRFWGYVGAVLHWTYFTSFRRNGPLWQTTVAWGALLGAFMCLTGLVVGIWRLRVRRRYRLRSGPSHSPYAGWMKWHHYTGLVFGVVTCTWAFSGAMSLSPFPSLRARPMTEAQRAAVAGTPMDLEQVTLDRLRAALAQFAPAFRPKELDVVQFQGRPYVIGHRPPAPWAYEDAIGSNEEQNEPRREHLIVSVTEPGSGPFRRFDDDRMWTIAKAAMPGVPMTDAAWLHEYDAYYYNQDGNRPLPVLRVRYDDAEGTWLYLDPNLGTLTRQDVRSRWSRWLYHGLHNLDFPFMYYKRPLWDAVVILLSIGGLALSATTLLPSWRRLVRHARHAVRAGSRWTRVGAGAPDSAARQPAPAVTRGGAHEPGRATGVRSEA